MSHLFQNIDHSDYIYCTNIDGKIDIANVIEAFKVAISACRKSRVRKVLWDYRKHNLYPAATERILIIEELSMLHDLHKQNGGENLKFAFLARKGLLPDYQPGLEVAEQNRLEIINTDSEAEVLQWLAD